jgi:hypothetical protein
MKKTLVIWLAVFVGLVVVGSALSLSGVFKSKNIQSTTGVQDSVQGSTPDSAQNLNSENASPVASATEFNNQNAPVTTDTPKNQSGETVASATATTNQLANPASTNCLKIGGRLVTKARGDGGEYSICYFENNQACEEWALMRGDCPVGGVAVTELNTIDQKYCAWSGGQTKAEANSICILKDGSKCSTMDFFNGSCPK